MYSKNNNCHEVFLSIGSNKGDKTANLHNGIHLIGNHAKIRVSAISSFYLTSPQNYTDQDWFVNAAIKIQTSIGDPFSLLRELQLIEKTIDISGKPFRFGPRIIDIDIIFFDDLSLKSTVLEIPHPRMHERCFVIKPICDIGGQVIHPVLQKTNLELLRDIENLPGQEVLVIETDTL